MKIDTEMVFPALRLYRERRLEMSENNIEQTHYVESEVEEMRDVIRSVESMVSRFEASGLYVGREVKP